MPWVFRAEMSPNPPRSSGQDLSVPPVASAPAEPPHSFFPAAGTERGRVGSRWEAEQGWRSPGQHPSGGGDIGLPKAGRHGASHQARGKAGWPPGPAKSAFAFAEGLDGRARAARGNHLWWHPACVLPPLLGCRLCGALGAADRLLPGFCSSALCSLLPCSSLCAACCQTQMRSVAVG